MTIKIAIPSTSITEREIEDILFHYNTMKPRNFDTLERAICKEGGFKITPADANTVPEIHKNPVMNQLEFEKRRARELRWNQQRYLVSYCNIPAFKVEEEILLFKTMSFVLGKENVAYYDTFGDAKKESPSIVENFLIKKSPKRTITCSPPTATQASILKRMLPI
jgi:hypothetical protein